MGTDQISTEKKGGRKQTCLHHKPPHETRKQPLPEVSDNGLARGDRAFAHAFKSRKVGKKAPGRSTIIRPSSILALVLLWVSVLNPAGL